MIGILNSQKVTVMMGVMLALLMAALDQTIVATAMPRIVRELNGFPHLSWVFTAYMLSSTVTVPIYGKLSDMYGRKYFILAAVIIFMTGSVLSGLSQNMTQLILFRALQGIGGGGIFANAFAIIGDLFPPSERGRWQGLFGGVFGIASVVGPTLGGWITDNASWRWNFFINIPVGILAILVIAFLMPKVVPAIKNRSVDFLGALFLTSGLVTLLLGLVRGGVQSGLFAISFISLLFFVIVEQRAKEPILPLTLFKNPVFSVSSFIVFLMGVGMFGAILYVPLFAQLVLGISATNSGTVLTPLMLGMVVASITTGQLVSRTGRYKWFAVAGVGIAGIGLYLLSGMTAQTSQLELILRLITTGIGLGMTMPIFTLVVQNAFDHSKLGVATASTQLFRSIGGTVGTAVLGGVLNSRLSEFIVKTKEAFASSITEVFLIATGLMGIAFITSFFLKEIPLRKSYAKRPALEEAGIEIGVEEGQLPAKDEPQLWKR